MSAVVVTIKDGTGAGKITGQIMVSMKKERVTVQEIIETRVIAEVEQYNKERTGTFHGLIQPTHAERVLNGYTMRDKKKIDAEQQVYSALDAFCKNGYFIMVDDVQATSLSQEIDVTPQTQIVFIKLIPLIGG